MIAVLICGRAEIAPFRGRNTFPLLGRPMMTYPILAGLHTKEPARLFLSTDSDEMARIAEFYGVEHIDRPAPLRSPDAALGAVFSHGYAEIVRRLGQAPELLVLMLTNAPTVTAGLIDQAVTLLRNDVSADAVITVTRRNEFAPRLAVKLAPDGTLHPYSAEVHGREDSYFPDSLLWAVRPERVFHENKALPASIVDTKTEKVVALVHEGYGDVDYSWQIPAVEAWLRKSGFTETVSPYGTSHGGKDSVRAKSAVGLTDWRARVLSVPPEKRVLISTIPFGEADPLPLQELQRIGAAVVINPLGRRLTEQDLAQLIPDFGILVAGTEPITPQVLALAPHLRLIARVGIGLDNVPLHAAREQGITCSYTPDAPAPAVAELAIGLMLDLLRGISSADRQMREGVWHRVMGRRLANMTVGVIGVGRVGRRVIDHLRGGFGGVKILANDLVEDVAFGETRGVEWVSKEEIYANADVITLHLPLTARTQDLITLRELKQMRPSTVVINTSRGGIVTEMDLKIALEEKLIAGAALDVFQHEPYSGPLSTVTTCLMTSHMGSMSRDCRARMEREAVDEVVRFVRGEPLVSLVPEDEFVAQAAMRR